MNLGEKSVLNIKEKISNSIFLCHWFLDFSVHLNYLGKLFKIQIIGCNSRGPSSVSIVQELEFLTKPENECLKLVVHIDLHKN